MYKSPAVFLGFGGLSLGITNRRQRTGAGRRGALVGSVGVWARRAASCSSCGSRDRPPRPP